MAQKFNVSTPSGFPELSPAQEYVRQNWLLTIRTVFGSHGFISIETPLVEREENLLGKGGNPKEMYVLKRLLDEEGDTSHSGNALRFDQTVPLALYVARHQNDITFPFKRCVMGPVFRGERAQKGRFRQFDQCDIDIIGSGELSFKNDALVVAIIVDLFQKLMPDEPFVVRINNRKILTGIFAHVGVRPENYKEAMDVIDDYEKISCDVFDEKLKTLGLTSEGLETIHNFMNLYSQVEKVKNDKGFRESNNSILIGALENTCFEQSDLLKQGIQELKEVLETLEGLGVPQDFYCLDFKIARGLDYYTGTVYETNLLNYKKLGSVCSGGRYDDLASVFTGKSMPGVGISIGLTRLLSQIFDAGIVVPNKQSQTQLMVIAADESANQVALEMGTKIRATGLVTENYLENKKLGKQFDYAQKLGIGYVLVIGEDEIAAGKYQLKNMQSGDKKEMSPDELLAWAKEMINS